MATSIQEKPVTDSPKRLSTEASTVSTLLTVDEGVHRGLASLINQEEGMASTSDKAVDSLPSEASLQAHAVGASHLAVIVAATGV